MAVYGYCRVSTDRQADEGESLDVQRRKLEGYAMQQGWALERMFVERGVSGSRPLEERAEGQKLLAAIRPGDIVITSKLDRMFRSALDALRVLDDLRKRGISLHMIDLGGDVTGNGISKLVFTILSAVAEAERERIRERVREVKTDQRTRGRYLGGSRPFGWQLGDDGARVADVEPDPEAIIPAALWRITARCEEALDLYEGFPTLYTKHRLRIVLTDGKRAKPMLYRMSNPKARAAAPSSEAYLWAVAEGYRDFGFEDLAPLLKAQHAAKKGVDG